MSHCIDLLLQNEELWRKRLDRECEKRRRMEEVYKHRLHSLSDQLRRETELLAQLRRLEQLGCGHQHATSFTATVGGQSACRRVIVGPDCEEGPNCSIREDEFFDALDAQLDKIEMQDELIEALKEANKSLSDSTGRPIQAGHPLFVEVNRVVRDHLVLCDPTASELSEAAGWFEIARDGEMRMYKREVESSDGKVLDPLQAVHVIDGVTARELCHYFWDVRYRLEWEFTIEQPPTVLEVCGEDTVVLHQVYRRVWPASQRDGVFWSHIRHVTRDELEQVLFPTTCLSSAAPANTAPLPNDQVDFWLVMNYSTDYRAPAINSQSNQMVRLKLDVVMVGQTLRRRGDAPLTRDNVCCRLLYAASIDPGGWAPASVLRKLAQREYPRFVKQFSQYVSGKTKHLSLAI